MKERINANKHVQITMDIKNTKCKKIIFYNFSNIISYCIEEVILKMFRTSTFYMNSISFPNKLNYTEALLNSMYLLSIIRSQSLSCITNLLATNHWCYLASGRCKKKVVISKKWVTKRETNFSSRKVSAPNHFITNSYPLLLLCSTTRFEMFTISSNYF